MDWIKAIKEHVDVPVLVGGVHLSIYARETLAYPELTMLSQVKQNTPYLSCSMHLCANRTFLPFEGSHLNTTMAGLLSHREQLMSMWMPHHFQPAT